VQIAARAKSPLARALQHHEGDRRILCPHRQALAHEIDHFERQRVQRLLRVQPRDADARAVIGAALLEQHYIGDHLDRHRAALLGIANPAPPLDGLLTVIS
jgi:hypothetical protein